MLQFFNQAEHFDDLALPDWMNTQEMKQMMNTLKQFPEQAREYFAYLARQKDIALQKAVDMATKKVQQEAEEAQREAEEAEQEAEISRQELEKTRQEAEEAKQEKEVALAELAELKKRLATQKNQKK